jgi:hypothetical protein
MLFPGALLQYEAIVKVDCYRRSVLFRNGKSCP